MPAIINTNINSLNAQRNVASSQQALRKNAVRLRDFILPPWVSCSRPMILCIVAVPLRRMTYAVNDML